MVFYDITGRRIRLRQPTGDQFEFIVGIDAGHPYLRMSGPPCWLNGCIPADAEIRVYLARASAQRIARETGLI